MRKTPSIRTTLLDALFRRPKPISRNSYYNAQSQLFPGRTTFQQFLMTTDTQDLHFLARAILNQLANHHYAVPPTRLLFNLADFEDKNRDAVKGGDYIAQDHYIHLVNLYLLGIYLFSYHRGIHRFCSAQLGAMKREMLGKNYQRKGHHSGRSTNYHIFATAWAQFVLFHDLAYPLERIAPTERTSKLTWLKPFDRIYKSLLKDCALRALARLIVARDLLDSTGASLGEIYLQHETRVYVRTIRSGRPVFVPVEKSDESNGGAWRSPNDAFAETVESILSEWSAAMLLFRVRSADAVRTLGPVVPDCSLAAVLEGGTGAPYVMVFKDRDVSPVWFFAPQDLPRSVPREPTRCWESAFLSGAPPSADCAWHYFVLDPENVIASMIEGTVGLEIGDLEEIHANLSENKHFREAGLISLEPASTQMYIAFDSLSQVLGYADNEAVERVNQIFSGYEAGFRSAAGRLHSVASNVIGDLIKESLERDKAFKPLTVVSRGDQDQRAEIVTEFVWSAFDDKGRESFRQRIARSLSNEIVKDVTFEESVRRAHQSIRSILQPMLLPKGDDVGNVLPSYFRAAIDLRQGLEVASEPSVDVKLTRCGLPPLGELTRDYLPAWALEQEGYEEGFVDHGLGAACLALSAAAFFSKVHEVLVDHSGSGVESGIKLLRLAVGTTSSLDEEWLRLENTLLSGEVAATIATHNLYPNRLPRANRSYRTRMSTTPFAFLALLADGLQKWDRQALVDLPRSEAVHVLPGDRFDLEIVGDLLHVLVVGPRLDPESEDRRLRQVLRDYLDDAERLIRVDIAQERQSWH